nr:hypothetical protein [Mycoplasmopsis bovis]
MAKQKKLKKKTKIQLKKKILKKKTKNKIKKKKENKKDPVKKENSKKVAEQPKLETTENDKIDKKKQGWLYACWNNKKFRINSFNK